MTLLKCGLSCWAAFLSVVSLCDGWPDPPSSLVESFFTCALCLMHGFNSYVFICTGRMFSAVKSLWNQDFTVCWTLHSLNNQGPVPLVQCALQAAGSAAGGCAQHQSCCQSSALPYFWKTGANLTAPSSLVTEFGGMLRRKQTSYTCLLTSNSHMSEVCWQGNGSQNQTHV